MAVVAHVFPQWISSHNAANLASDTYKVMLVASTSNAFTWNSTGQSVATVTNFLAGSGAGSLTEVSTSGTGYTRQSLTGLSVVQTASVSTSTPAYTTLKCTGTIAWSSSTISATYAMFYDYTLGGNSDTNGVPVCYWDFGGTQATSSATFTLALATSAGASIPTALVEWTDN
jgi:hypothetical protein